ncbi:hypothetical protein PsWM33_05134 [Pseudovibrio sp. WM33]|nr:hypothetical protein PsWM33_05134 [Pseudovibrio sp. WM33]
MRWDELRGSREDRPTLMIKKLIRFLGCVVQIHKFAAADREGCFHTHPAWALRVVLWGGYVEETGCGRWRVWFPGRIGIVRPSYEHRIAGLMNGKSSWSLWVRGPKVAPIKLRGY